jgi:GTP-binding protein Era
MVLEVLKTVRPPRVLCLSKADLTQRPHRERWLERAGEYASIVEVSAIARRNLHALIDALLPLLPVGAPLYPPTELTNANREFRLGEIIREKIYLLTEEEVPYRTAVRVDEVRVSTLTQPPRTSIHATILVAGERYKAMLIGAGGRMVREIRLAARPDLERLLDSKVTLELRVAVETGWLD